MPLARSDYWRAVGLMLALFAVYSANGREIGSVDSQATPRDFMLFD
jgi:hypothetical protein